MENKYNTFEERFERIEEITRLLGSDNVGIDESIKLFKEASSLRDECSEILKNANKQIVEIIKENDDGKENTEGEDGAPF